MLFEVAIACTGETDVTCCPLMMVALILRDMAANARQAQSVIEWCTHAPAMTQKGTKKVCARDSDGRGLLLSDDALVPRRREVPTLVDSGSPQDCHAISRRWVARMRTRGISCSPIWSRAVKSQLVDLLHEGAGYAAASVDVVTQLPAPSIASTLDRVPVPARKRHNTQPLSQLSQWPRRNQAQRQSTNTCDTT